jgi:hypothetical protein
MSADHAADEWQEMMEVHVIERAHDRRAWRGELEDHEPRARAQHARHLGQPAVERRDVPDPERDRRTVHRVVRERQLLRIRRDGRKHAARGLSHPGSQHRNGEIRPDDEPREAGLPAQLRADVERSRAQIEISSVGHGAPAERTERAPAP